MAAPAHGCPVVDEREEVLAVEWVLADELRAKVVLHRGLHLFLSLAEEADVCLSLADADDSLVRLHRHEDVIVDAGRPLRRRAGPVALGSGALGAVRRVGNLD